MASDDLWHTYGPNLGIVKTWMERLILHSLFYDYPIDFLNET